ncbi:MAG TPA: hypothetical protein PLD27_07580 [bacterium]|nr:hypothetical protein [bacterium]HOL47716.1 hypothetical protein [bacterium]HPQ19062.1 hypothetical protein [bacterium]
MGIPNTLTKIVNKYNEIVDFKISKIANALMLAILDIENCSKYTAELRAKKYALKVADRIYKDFYDLNYLKQDFITKYINFNPEERINRLANAFATERLCIVLLEIFKDQIAPDKVSDRKEDLLEFIKKTMNVIDEKDTNNKSLFPLLTNVEKEEIINFLFDKILSYSQIELRKDQICPHREFIQDTIEKVLKDIGEIDLAEGFMLFREGKIKLKANEISELQFTKNGIHHEIVQKTLEWNIEHECDSIFSLNDWVLGRHNKDMRELIMLSEKRYKNDVLAAIDKILKRINEIKIVIIAGPSCSNKTTTTVITGLELKKIGLKLKQLNIDDYFKDLKDQPKDEFGDYDFEMPEAIDIELLNVHLDKLMKGQAIQKPNYNFKTGVRQSYSEFYLKEDEILLIDCLHGLYRKLTASVPQHQKFSIYIESMNVVRNTDGSYTKWADVRMLKRMIRDMQYRSYKPAGTLGHWWYVRKGELKHIIPYIFSTDVVINSGLPYELPVLKFVIGENFPSKSFIEQLRMEGRLDAYIRGIRTLTLLDTVIEYKKLNNIPSTSPIREFIGGSSYIIPHNE